MDGVEGGDDASALAGGSEVADDFLNHSLEDVTVAAGGLGRHLLSLRDNLVRLDGLTIPSSLSRFWAVNPKTARQGEPGGLPI